MNTITIRRPDDWHLHLRDGDMLRHVLPWTAAQFARAIIMPNLTPPVATTAAAASYRERILAAMPDGAEFQPLMTCYLTDTTDPAVDIFDREAAPADIGEGDRRMVVFRGAETLAWSIAA